MQIEKNWEKNHKKFISFWFPCTTYDHMIVGPPIEKVDLLTRKIVIQNGLIFTLNEEEKLWYNKNIWSQLYTNQHSKGRIFTPLNLKKIHN